MARTARARARTPGTPDSPGGQTRAGNIKATKQSKGKASQARADRRSRSTISPPRPHISATRPRARPSTHLPKITTPGPSLGQAPHALGPRRTLGLWRLDNPGPAPNRANGGGPGRGAQGTGRGHLGLPGTATITDARGLKTHWDPRNPQVPTAPRIQRGRGGWRGGRGRAAQAQGDRGGRPVRRPSQQRRRTRRRPRLRLGERFPGDDHRGEDGLKVPVRDDRHRRRGGISVCAVSHGQRAAQQPPGTASTRGRGGGLVHPASGKPRDPPEVPPGIPTLQQGTSDSSGSQGQPTYPRQWQPRTTSTTERQNKQMQSRANPHP